MHTAVKRSRAAEYTHGDSSRSSSLSPTPTSKVLRTTPSTESLNGTPRSGAPLLCTLPPTCHPPHNAPTQLLNSAELEAHYAKYHAYVCEERGCAAVFPNARLLELHQTECHDPLAAVKKERGGKIFACHLEACPRTFADPKKRRLHLIQAHSFPKEYFFAVTNKGVGGLLKKWGDGASMLRKPWKERTGTADDGGAMDVEEESSSEDDGAAGAEVTAPSKSKSTVEAPKHDDLNTLAKSMDSLSLIPSSIRFGRGGKGGNVRSAQKHAQGTSGLNARADQQQLPAISSIPDRVESADDGGISINIDAALEALKSEVPSAPQNRPLGRGMLRVNNTVGTEANSSLVLGGGRGRGTVRSRGRARARGFGRGRG